MAPRFTPHLALSLGRCTVANELGAAWSRLRSSAATPVSRQGDSEGNLVCRATGDHQLAGAHGSCLPRHFRGGS